jgi:hypothetical protein
MVLGAIQPISQPVSSPISRPISRTGVTQVQTRNPQAPINTRLNTQNAATSGNEPGNSGNSGDAVKKWGPWVIGAILLYVLINKR